MNKIFDKELAMKSFVRNILSKQLVTETVLIVLNDDVFNVDVCMHCQSISYKSIYIYIFITYL